MTSTVHSTVLISTRNDQRTRDQITSNKEYSVGVRKRILCSQWLLTILNKRHAFKVWEITVHANSLSCTEVPEASHSSYHLNFDHPNRDVNYKIHGRLHPNPMWIKCNTVNSLNFFLFFFCHCQDKTSLYRSGVVCSSYWEYRCKLWTLGASTLNEL